ncbi:MAG TPA: hypothetical protein VIH21_08975 [Dehalococcoidia bacterium]
MPPVAVPTPILRPRFRLIEVPSQAVDLVADALESFRSFIRTEALPFAHY